MQISENLITTIANEFDFVVEKVNQEGELPHKLYFFSGAYNIVQRVYNLEFDPSLLLIHTVLQDTYNLINSRFASIVTGKDPTIPLPEELFDSLATALAQLSSAIRNHQDFLEPLQRILIIGYVTTGNGYYLLQKGLLEI